ncbi:unnamed protein product [Phyllotreta striolata]|uniref:UBX domain-containing protein n=1 Tax=Phyllotreta striolata TaxID=444603 RepID=A0A9N9TQ11_PHYSR|nr:unnamed protein product [Phyllotreta striolata]
MAEKIKKFFARKKADARFKMAGPGRRLAESSTAVVGPSKSKPAAHVPAKVEPTEAARQAAEAALLRLQGQRKDVAFNTSLAAIQAKVRRELEAENKKAPESVQKQEQDCRETEYECSSHLAVNGVYFKCPLISDEILTKEEWKGKIKEFLFSTLAEERIMTSCLIIYSCNYNRTKVTDCANVLIRYLDNLIANPDETKFHKIRRSNAAYRDKVAPVLGADEFLYAAGFRPERIDDEDFLVWSADNLDDAGALLLLRETLKAEERVELEIERSLRVLSPAQASRRVELPADFFAMSADELKRERQQRSETAEKQLQLRTKAMREKDEIREIRKYKFCLIRIRFPDGLYLQGTFSVYEKYSEVMEFVGENLEHEGLPFYLADPTGRRLEEIDKEASLMDLRLVPATILLFHWDEAIEEDLKAAGNVAYLKPEVMLMVESL